jgi:hypothetical protein
MLLLFGASVLFLSGVLVVYFAVRIGDAAGTPKLGIADIRYECCLYIETSRLE